jgi:hypothetical protein
MDCFVDSLLAMTWLEHTTTPSGVVMPAKAGHPVRCGFWILSPTSLEYWIARLRGRRRRESDSIFKQRRVLEHSFAISPRHPREFCCELPAH